MKLFALLERKTNGKALIQELEGLRFLAILPVVLQHFTERLTKYALPENELTGTANWFFNFLSGGGVGVYLFFMISGFILAVPFAKNAMDGFSLSGLKPYFMRRLTRLEPPYIVIMTLLLAIVVAGSQLPAGEAIKHWLAGITYTNNLIFHHHNPLNPVTWSLEVEIQFYLIAPFLAHALFSMQSDNHRAFLLVLLMIAAIVLQSLTGIDRGDNFLRYTLLGQIQYFLAGFLMAHIYLLKEVNREYRNILWDAAGIAAFIIMINEGWIQGISQGVKFLLASGILFLSAFRGYFIQTLLTRKYIMAIGGMCYTIYLIHLPLAEIVTNLIHRFNFSDPWMEARISIATFSVLLLVLVPITYLVLEKPFMQKGWFEKIKSSLSSVFVPAQ